MLYQLSYTRRLSTYFSRILFGLATGRAGALDDDAGSGFAENSGPSANTHYS